MRKRLGVVLLLIALLIPGLVLAAGTCVETAATFDDRIVITITCTADAATAVFSDHTIARAMTDAITTMRGTWWLTVVKTRPGSTAPTTASDLTLEDASGYDVLGGAGTNMIDATSTLDFYPQNSQGDYRYWPVVSTLTQKIANNAVNSAISIVDYVFTK